VGHNLETVLFAHAYEGLTAHGSLLHVYEGLTAHGSFLPATSPPVMELRSLGILCVWKESLSTFSFPPADHAPVNVCGSRSHGESKGEVFFLILPRCGGFCCNPIILIPEFSATCWPGAFWSNGSPESVEGNTANVDMESRNLLSVRMVCT